MSEGEEGETLGAGAGGRGPGSGKGTGTGASTSGGGRSCCGSEGEGMGVLADEGGAACIEDVAGSGESDASNSSPRGSERRKPWSGVGSGSGTGGGGGGGGGGRRIGRGSGRVVASEWEDAPLSSSPRSTAPPSSQLIRTRPAGASEGAAGRAIRPSLVAGGWASSEASSMADCAHRARHGLEGEPSQVGGEGAEARGAASASCCQGRASCGRERCSCSGVRRW